MNEHNEEDLCPMCPHRCPLTAPSCRRGNDYAAWVFEQKQSPRETEEETPR